MCSRQGDPSAPPIPRPPNESVHARQKRSSVVRRIVEGAQQAWLPTLNFAEDIVHA